MTEKIVHDDYKDDKSYNLPFRAELWISFSIIISFIMVAAILETFTSFGSIKIFLYLGISIISFFGAYFGLKKAKVIIEKEKSKIEK